MEVITVQDGDGENVNTTLFRELICRMPGTTLPVDHVTL